MSKNKTRVDAREFLKSLEGYGDGVDKKTKEAVLKCALAIERDAKKNLTNSGAVDSGRLRASLYTDASNVNFYKVEIGTDLSKVRRRKRKKGKGVSTNVEYAPHVEFGTYKMAARPFLRPAYNKNVEKLNKKIKNILGGK